MESESRTLKKLQQQVDALVKSNDLKEKDIKNDKAKERRQIEIEKDCGEVSEKARERQR